MAEGVLGPKYFLVDRRRHWHFQRRGLAVTRNFLKVYCDRLTRRLKSGRRMARPLPQMAAAEPPAVLRMLVSKRERERDLGREIGKEGEREGGREEGGSKRAKEREILLGNNVHNGHVQRNTDTFSIYRHTDTLSSSFTASALNKLSSSSSSSSSSSIYRHTDTHTLSIYRHTDSHEALTRIRCEI